MIRCNACGELMLFLCAWWFCEGCGTWADDDEDYS
jgi:hypothetical protein